MFFKKIFACMYAYLVYLFIYFIIMLIYMHYFLVQHIANVMYVACMALLC